FSFELTIKYSRSMKKKLPDIVGVLLGLAFLTFGLNFFLKFLPMPSPPEGSLAIPFFQSTGQSGFMAFVKVCEIIGAVLVAIPKTRNWGLLVLGPIVVNILAFNLFIAGGTSILQPPVLIVALFSAYLLWVERDRFLNLIR
ncbi:MAG: hypothetical protein AAF514_24985, partial [Verrucomicrobiota bacterium]